MKDRYTNVGLVSNGEEWYQIRTLVQQDMMRPKSALYYISDLEDIATELVDKIGSLKNTDGIVEPMELVQAYALEAVGCIFMGTRLGALKGTGDGKRLIELQTDNDTPFHSSLHCSIPSYLQEVYQDTDRGI